jgi:hypothetical protein
MWQCRLNVAGSRASSIDWQNSCLFLFDSGLFLRANTYSHTLTQPHDEQLWCGGESSRDAVVPIVGWHWGDRGLSLSPTHTHTHDPEPSVLCKQIIVERKHSGTEMWGERGRLKPSKFRIGQGCTQTTVAEREWERATIHSCVRAMFNPICFNGPQSGEWVSGSLSLKPDWDKHTNPEHRWCWVEKSNSYDFNLHLSRKNVHVRPNYSTWLRWTLL